MPQNPEQRRPKEQEQRPYYLASRFPTKQAAEAPYLASSVGARLLPCSLPDRRYFLAPLLTRSVETQSRCRDAFKLEMQCVWLLRSRNTDPVDGRNVDPHAARKTTYASWHDDSFPGFWFGEA